MKTITDGKQIIRVKDLTALSMTLSGTWQYTTKQEWKQKVRDAAKDTK